LIRKDIPAGDYAIFTFHAKYEDLPLILEYINQTWLPKSGITGDIPFVILSYGNRVPGDDSLLEQQVYVPLA
jgi:DNA gyrase inhibitor GyrI